MPDTSQERVLAAHRKIIAALRDLTPAEQDRVIEAAVTLLDYRKSPGGNSA